MFDFETDFLFRLLGMLLYTFFPFIIAFVIGILVIPKVILISKKKRLFDSIDSRKSHRGAISRLGGFSFLPAVALSVIACQLAYYWLFNDQFLIVRDHNLYHLVAFFWGFIILYYIGLLDDIVGMSFRKKLITQFIAVCVMPIIGINMSSLTGIFGIEAMPDYVSIPISMIISVGIINAINLIDGVDGLCACLVAVIMFPVSIWLLFNNRYIECTISFSVIGIIISFLRFNLTRGKLKLFMGDAGSLVAGFCICYVLLAFIEVNQCSNHVIYKIPNYLIFAISLVFVPLTDAFRVFTNRIIKGKSPFYPDRTHIHHYILEKGYSHKATTAIISIIAVAIYSINFGLSYLVTDPTLLLLLLLGYGLTLLYIVPIKILPNKNKVKNNISGGA